MSIKSDRWIKRMALEHGMIEPFEPRQVRDAQGAKIVSYGVSSYGYDVRCANDFKIFTNINTTIVDPKLFDARNFVDFVGDCCIIPPNSFALAHTVEYFRVPENVLVLCVGKSTYARCFSGDTRVALADGSAPTLEEMARRHQNGELFFGYSVGPLGRIIVTLLDAPRFIGREGLLRITLDDGATIDATPDHRFLMRDGRMAEAGNLRPGDSVMPLYREPRRGYEMVYQPLNGHLYPTHRLADEWNLRHGVYDDLPGTHRHHIDHNRRNNFPTNLLRMAAGEHIRLHNEINYGEDFDAQHHGESIRQALARLSEDTEWRANFSRKQSERAKDFWTEDRHGEARARLIEARRNPSQETIEAHRLATKKRYENALERLRQSALSAAAWARDDGSRRAAQAEIARQIKIRREITADVVRKALDETGSIRGAARVLACDRTAFRRFPDVLAAFRGTPPPSPRNHKIAGIQSLPGEHDVYCLTVPEAGNFALEAGVFVQNCGVIVNVTPLEPGWEGQVTLEFSNTTPLPAKIYANEGVAQMLFLESDEVCETSYRDRAGKYMGQRGVTLPKT